MIADPGDPWLGSLAARLAALGHEAATVGTTAAVEAAVGTAGGTADGAADGTGRAGPERVRLVVAPLEQVSEVLADGLALTRLLRPAGVAVVLVTRDPAVDPRPALAAGAADVWLADAPFDDDTLAVRLRLARLRAAGAGDGPSDDDLLRRAFDVADAALVVTDPARPGNPVVYANDRYVATSGYPRAELIGRSAPALVGPDTDEEAVHRAARALAHGRPAEVETVRYRRDGSPFWSRLRLSVVRDERGVVVREVGVLGDLSADRDRLADLERLGYTDELTGLANRRQLLQRLGETEARCKRTGHAMAVIYLDIDHFKRVNDQHGHQAGDDVLRAVGHRLASAVRDYETAARIGGDEFVVVLEEGTTPHAGLVAKRVLRQVQVPIAVDGATVQVSASIGVAESRPGDRTARELLTEADLALYRAKRAGGGQVALARPA